MQNSDSKYMLLAIELARKALGNTSPNPCVGAVIVHDGTVVGQGYHLKAGTPHAEVNAIADAGSAARGATIYVTLEPCNHQGRTPPCTQAILEAGITRVVVGMPDPNPSVAGNGATFLREKGVQVETGIHEEECRKFNLPFIKHCATGVPWVVMKAGMSLDGRISYQKGSGGRITGAEAGTFTHTLRHTYDSILVGIDTALIDDPSLTTRIADSVSGKDPVRVVLDTNLRMSTRAKMLSQKSSAPTIIFCGNDAPDEPEEKLIAAGAKVIRVDVWQKGLDLQQVLVRLGEENIQSVLVEGGAAIHGAMLKNNLVDEVFLFVAPMFIGSGGTPLLNWPVQEDEFDPVRLANMDIQKLGNDILVHGFLK